MRPTPRLLLFLLPTAACTGPEGDVVQNSAPQVVVSFPTDGAEVTEDSMIRAQGVVNDDDGDSLLSLTWFLDDAPVEGCTAEATPIEILAMGGLSCEVYLPQTPSGRSTLTLAAVDAGDEEASDQVEVLLVPALPPEVSLLSPVEGDLLRIDGLVRLAGTVSDDDDPILDLDIWWESSVAGRLEDALPAADGAIDTTAILPQGDDQDICLVAMDPSGLQDQACARVDVRASNTAPTCQIARPEDGTVGPADLPVDLTGTVSDGEMPLADLFVTWSSDKDGDLGTSIPSAEGVVAQLVTLSRDTHVLLLRVEDDGGLTCTDAVVYTAAGGPAVEILEPSDSEVFEQGESIWFEAWVQDDETACPDLRLSWSSDLDGEIATDPASAACVTSFSIESLSVGEHTVILTAMDGDENRYGTSVTLSVVDCLDVWYRDLDGDGHGDAAASASACVAPVGYVIAGDDCDDWNPAVSPSSPEDCNGLDDDCDGTVDDGLATLVRYRDGDGDGYGDATSSLDACYSLSGYVTDASDCDDGEPTVHPGADEACDNLDNDCDGTVDEGLPYPWGTPWYRDGDGDGYGTPSVMKTACEAPAGHVDNADDCDDDRDDAFPGAAETCNEEDDDCDGATDESDAVDAVTLYEDADGDGFGRDDVTMMGCRFTGYVEAGGDCDDTDPTAFPGTAETCDGQDNDCNGAVDDGFTFPYDTTWYRDADADGYGAASAVMWSCEMPSDFVANDEDCDDSDPTVHPGTEEVCDEVDDDCDGTVDGAGSIDALTWFRDADGDGHGERTDSLVACDAAGYTLSGDDCDDTRAGIHPGAAEACDGIDDDCDGDIDEEFSFTVDTPWYRDGDGDGWGTSTAATAGCEAPAGYVAVAGDCDDARDDVFPTSTERCNEVDDDCDGTVDETDASDALPLFPDGDGDAFGRTAEGATGCLIPGYATTGEDCDDGDPTVYPGAPETCDGTDEDCDGSTDEDWPYPFDTAWYRDLDTDGYGTANAPLYACAEPAGYVTTPGDCNDADPAASPAETEVCNTVDDDCDGVVDEADASDAGTWYLDVDGDGYGNDATATTGCAPAGFVAVPGDCDDDSPDVNPSQTDTCNGVDDNCDGTTDEDYTLPFTTTWYLDADADGFGELFATARGCEAPAGYVTDSNDCADWDTDVFPGAVETCNYQDDDCDGEADEDEAIDATPWYADDDADGYGDPLSPMLACFPPIGYVGDASDCDDSDWYIKPGAGC